MNANADVRSLEKLEEYLDDSRKFKVTLLKLLEELQLELRKMTTWIDVEVSQYWQQELVKSQRRFVEAQDALTRCMSYVREDERKPCTEQKKHLKVAKERRALCEEKIKIARGAAQAWERTMRKHQGKLQRSRDLSESDLVVAITQLSNQIETLREYAGLRSAAVSKKSTSTTPDDTSKSTEHDAQESNQA